MIRGKRPMAFVGRFFLAQEVDDTNTKVEAEAIS
jgi:hypothetical protein